MILHRLCYRCLNRHVFIVTSVLLTIISIKLIFNLEGFNGGRRRGSSFAFTRSDRLRNINNYPELISAFNTEKYLLKNRRLFSPHHEMINPLNFTFLIPGAGVCARAMPFLLVIIPSVAEHRDWRASIRNTWLGSAENDTWPMAIVAQKVAHVFLFGMPEPEAPVSDDFQQLKAESEQYGDIVIADFVDSYRNLTLKMMAGFQWMLRFCSKAQIMLKADEDTFINMPLLIEVLDTTLNERREKYFVIGLRHGYPRPLVSREGRWAVTKQEYPLPVFPRYLYGHMYGVSGQAVPRLLDTARHMRLIAPEDAFITGILAKSSGISRFHAPSFPVCCKTAYDCELIWNEKVGLTTVENAQMVQMLWSKLKNHTCNDVTPFFEPIGAKQKRNGSP